MRSIRLLIILCLLAGSIVQAKINLPASEDITLDNGLMIRVINRPELPLFTLNLTYRAGSIYDPVGKEGLASLCNEMLMRGTKSRDARQIAEEISFGGGTLANFCGRESAGFAGEFLSENGAKGFQILSDILLNSTFANDELIKIRTRTVAELESRIEDASAVATEYFYSEVLGDNRYSHLPSGVIETVTLLNRDDVLDFFHQAYTPDNCILVICGDVDKNTVKKWAQQYLGQWKGKSSLPQVTANFAPVTGRQILILDKQDATQTQVRIGNVGLKIGSPDYIPFEAARTVFAGSFTSRLVNEIRVNRGLTYSVSMRSSQYAPGGMVYVSTFTKNQSVGEVLDIILNETKRIQTEAIPDSEFFGAVKYRTGLYPLRFETNDDIADVFSNLWLYDLDKSYYETFQEKMKALTSNDALRVTQRDFPFTDYRIVLVGNADEILEQVEKYGQATVKPLIAN